VNYAGGSRKGGQLNEKRRKQQWGAGTGEKGKKRKRKNPGSNVLEVGEQGKKGKQCCKIFSDPRTGIGSDLPNRRRTYLLSEKRRSQQKTRRGYREIYTKQGTSTGKCDWLANRITTKCVAEKMERVEWGIWMNRLGLGERQNGVSKPDPTQSLARAKEN